MAQRRAISCSKSTLAVALVLVSVAGCKGQEDRLERRSEQSKVAAPASPEPGSAEGEEAAAGMAPAEDAEGDDIGYRGSAAKSLQSRVEKKESSRAPAAESPTTQSRSWFPETFLFEPLVVTDDDGRASVSATVPDRLTTWRVLALAHTRGGRQAGDATTFLGTLPSYIEVVAPAQLRVGDRVDLPVQVVNTTDAALSETVTLRASGARLGGGGQVTVPPRSTRAVRARLTADQPTTAEVMARLGDADAVTRRIPVLPRGREVVQRRAGTLARPVEMSFDELPADATGRFARVSVYSGARAVLSQELQAATARRGLWDDAFSLLLIGRAPELLESFGMELDDGELRAARILATQRAVRHALTMPLSTAVPLARGAGDHDDPVLSSIAERARAVVAREQAPDGTCGQADGWSLQRLLVATAECARAVQGDRKVVLRAEGAIERHGERIDDPYTAAAVVAAGLASGASRTRLVELIESAAKPRPGGGGKIIAVPSDAERSDGTPPSVLEATALAVLALDEGPLRSELGASVLAGYRGSAGWGDGRANLAAMEAVLALYSDPLPSKVELELLRDGEVVAEGSADPEQPGSVVTLEHRAAGDRSSHRWTVRAEPALPGLAFDFAMTTYAPWPEPSAGGGLELQVVPPAAPAVGRPGLIEVRGLAPSRPLTVRIELPAGVVVDDDDLERRQRAGELRGFRHVDGRVELDLPPPEAGSPFTTAVRVIPTLAGQLWSGAAVLSVGSPDRMDRVVPPSRWTVR